MLPHATQPGLPIELCNTELQAFTLVFENPSGRISVSLNRTAIPAGRDGEGAVKRDLLGFRVLSFLFRFLLVVYLSMFYAVLPPAAQSDSNEKKYNDDAKREEVTELKKDDR